VISGNSLDVIEIDAASNGSVERIRELQERLQYCTPGKNRVVILDEAHSMSRDAYNSLLKLIEEPPAFTTFILCTTEPGKVLATVRSRCSPYEFTALPVPVIVRRLREVCAAEGMDVEDELLARLADQAAGIMRNGLKLLDQCKAVGISTLASWLKLTGDTDYAPGIIACAVAGDHAGLLAALDDVLMAHSDYPAITASLVACLCDVLRLQSGGEVAVQGSALAARQELAGKAEKAAVVAAMKVLWDLQTRVRAEDRRSGLSLAAVMVASRLGPVLKRENGNGNGSSHRPVTASDLVAMPGFAISP
jgi:DNA polymerase-3 subunit gamma/tau